MKDDSTTNSHNLIYTFQGWEDVLFELETGGGGGGG